MNLHSALVLLAIVTNKSQDCPKCSGRGRLPDQKHIGATLRQYRESRKVTEAEVARRMGYTRAYLNQLELGRRVWNKKLIEGYYVAVNK